MYKKKFIPSSHLSLRRTPLVPTRKKPVPYFLLQIDSVCSSITPVLILVFTTTRPLHIYLQLRARGPNNGTPEPVWQHARHHMLLILLLDQTMTFSLFPGLFAKARRDLIDGQDEEVHDAARTTPAYRNALRRRSSGHLPQPPPVIY